VDWFVFVKVRTGVGLLSIWKWTWRFQKRREISSPPERL